MQLNAQEIAVETKNLTKSFGTVKSNQNISIYIKKGEILALLGENGSGKSTLVNMLAGIYTPESGKIIINNKEKHFKSPQDAIAEGIGMVHQHFKLVEVMSALENITLGERHGGFFINKKAIQKRIEELEKQFGFDINLNQKIYTMSVSEKQTVEIIKMLYHGARILILDEPTAVLTPQETKRLFEVLRRMKAEGCSIIIITHKLNEVMEISDRVTILHKGRLAGTVVTKDSSENEIASMMMGSKVEISYEYKKVELSEKPLLTVDKLSCVDKIGNKKLDEVSFELYGGEMFGIAGIVGSGQKEICEILTGLQRASGSAIFENSQLLTMSPLQIKKLGIRMNFVPEDRLGMGLVAGMDVTDNILLRTYDIGHGIAIDRKGGDKKAEYVVNRYEISTPSIRHKVKNLSGGNIQKVLLSREIEMSPKFLIVAYPFRGLDIGATTNIIQILNEQKEKGVGILLICEDLDQLCAISDRVMVLHDGKNMGIINPHKVSKNTIGLMMMGKNDVLNEDDASSNEEGVQI